MKFIKLLIVDFAILLVFLSFISTDFTDIIVRATSEIDNNSSLPLNQVRLQPELTPSGTINQTDNLEYSLFKIHLINNSNLTYLEFNKCTTN